MQEGDEVQSEVGDREGRWKNWKAEEEEREKLQIAATSATSDLLPFLFLFYGLFFCKILLIQLHPLFIPFHPLFTPFHPLLTTFHPLLMANRHRFNPRVDPSPSG